jgi:hypothetical protein
VLRFALRWVLAVLVLQVWLMRGRRLVLVALA